MPTQQPPGIDIVDEQTAYLVAARLHALLEVATYCDGTATQLRNRIVVQLRHEGLDAATGGLRGIFGESSDAARTADKCVQPLRAIQADCFNVARNAVLFRTRMETLVFNPIKQAQAARKHGAHGGLKV